MARLRRRPGPVLEGGAAYACQVLYGIETEDASGSREVVEHADADVPNFESLVEFGRLRKLELASELTLALQWWIVHYADVDFTERVTESPLP